MKSPYVALISLYYVLQAKGLSAKLVIYTKSEAEAGDVRRLYWPVVKCVTIRVPNNDLLKHVTLVDLPGNGDRNKSRDKMWKTVIYHMQCCLLCITVLSANCDIMLFQSTDNHHH